MKNILFVAAFCCLLLSCSKADLDPVNAYLGQEIKLKKGKRLCIIIANLTPCALSG